MLQGEHSAILWTFIKLPFVIKIFVLSIFEWLFYTGFTVFLGKSAGPHRAVISNPGVNHRSDCQEIDHLCHTKQHIYK